MALAPDSTKVTVGEADVYNRSLPFNSGLGQNRTC